MVFLTGSGVRLSRSLSVPTECLGKRCHMLMVTEYFLIVTRRDLFLTIRLIKGRLITSVPTWTRAHRTQAFHSQ